MSTNTIVGFKLFYKGSELADMSTKAVAYHKERSEAYRKLADDFRKVKQGERDSLSVEAQIYSMKSGGGGDPGQHAEDDAARHERKKRFHEHVVNHVNKEATYELTTSELSIYGINPH